MTRSKPPLPGRVVHRAGVTLTALGLRMNRRYLERRAMDRATAMRRHPAGKGLAPGDES